MRSLPNIISGNMSEVFRILGRELMANRKDPVVARPVNTTADTATEDDLNIIIISSYCGDFLCFEAYLTLYEKNLLERLI